MKKNITRLIVFGSLMFLSTQLSAQVTRPDTRQTTTSDSYSASNHLQNYSATPTTVSNNDIIGPGLNPDVPIDNGVLLLIAAGILLGGFKAYHTWKNHLVFNNDHADNK